jgi:hypothetical protein
MRVASKIATISEAITTDENKTLSISLNEELPWQFLSANSISTVILIITKTKRFVAWMLPLSLAGVGAAFIQMQRREYAIEEKEARILEELDTLYPTARAQVLIRVTVKELSRKLQWLNGRFQASWSL